jgi:hypothetical protein
LIDPAHGDCRPLVDGNVISASVIYRFFTAIADFPGWVSFTPTVAAGELSNAVADDHDSMPRGGTVVPGAFG